MINYSNASNEAPYRKFKQLYELALDKKQNNIQAICISSINKKTSQPNSRYVNLKFINGKEWIFFSNYNSPKAKEFAMNKEISALFFWDSINSQIRLRGKIFKTDEDFSDKYFSQRNKEKNILSIISDQSKILDSYESLEKRFKDFKQSELIVRPKHWGGFSFIPSYFEFWSGHKNRLNKREVFELDEGGWSKYYLEP